MVAIPHGKGVIKCHNYNGNINAETFADFMKENLPEMSKTRNNTKGRLFLQDGDPSQNSRMAQDAIDTIPYRLFKIPSRSPDLNPIANVFHLVDNQLHKNAMEKHISKETLNSFVGGLKNLY